MASRRSQHCNHFNHGRHYRTVVYRNRHKVELLRVLREPVPEAALHLLEIAERELKAKSPTLAWDNLTMVQGWIRELVKNGAAG